MNGENKHENSQFQKLFLVLLASLIAACAAPESRWDKEREVQSLLLKKKAEMANEFFKDKILGVIVETELTYRLFKIRRNDDKFREKSPAILDSPGVSFVAKPNDERDGGVYDFGGLEYYLAGDRFYASKNFVRTHARLSKEVYLEMDSKGQVDGVLKTSISDEIIYYNFSYLSEWDRNYGGFGLSNEAYLTVVENAQDITFLYVGSPLVMAHLSSVTEVRDINRIKYEVVETFAPDKYPVHQIAIPTGKLLRYASGGEPLVLKLYGEMKGRGNLVYYIVKIPNWYLRAYIFAGLKHGLISRELAGPKIVAEFDKLQKIPHPTFPVFQIETVNDENGDK